MINPLWFYFDDFKKTLEKRGENPELEITSLPNLNKKLWGMHLGKMTVIGARTSMGKTSFIMQLINDFINKNNPVLYISFEMTHEELLERLFCLRYKID